MGATSALLLVQCSLNNVPDVTMSNEWVLLTHCFLPSAPYAMFIIVSKLPCHSTLICFPVGICYVVGFMFLSLEAFFRDNFQVALPLYCDLFSCLYLFYC